MLELNLRSVPYRKNEANREAYFIYDKPRWPNKSLHLTTAASCSREATSSWAAAGELVRSGALRNVSRGGQHEVAIAGDR